MSIPKGTTSFFGRYDDAEKFRLIPQAGIRYDRNPGKINYQYCWDMNVSPYTGKLYCAPCDESGRGLHARMVEYDWDKDESRVVISPERYVLPRERHMPYTKFHESITFLPNGHLMATTHSTDRGKNQPEWMPFAHIDHIWDGFPGSYLFEYDPDTDKTISHGIPAPRESIYGMTYDAKYNALYMIGFMRGHVYRYSLDDHSIKDLGKAAEVFCYRLHAGPDGHIYGCTKSGFLWRINVDTQELEDMNFRVPPQRKHYVLNTWYRYMARAVNVSDHEFIFATGSNYNFFLVDTNTLEVKPVGPVYDFDFVDDFVTNCFGTNEIGIDGEGTIWFTAHNSSYAICTDEFYKTPAYIPTLLVRWEYKKGKKPEVCGMLGDDKGFLNGDMCLSVDAKRDRLFVIGGWREYDKPAERELTVFMLDLAELRPRLDRGEKGPIVPLDWSVRPMNEEELAREKKRIENYNVYTGEAAGMGLEKNPFVPFHIGKVSPVRLWREVPREEIENSKVQSVGWNGKGQIVGVCGQDKKYVFTLSHREYVEYASEEAAWQDEQMWVFESILQYNLSMTKLPDGRVQVKVPTSFEWVLTDLRPYDELTLAEEKNLVPMLWPQPVDVPEDLKLPSVAGRQYLAKATASVRMGDGTTVVGTKDGLLCLVRYGKVYNLGNAAPLGPVRCLTVSADGKLVWGTAGDDEDMGTMFTYDAVNGLVQRGTISYNVHGWMDGPTAAHVLTSIALSPDGKYLAVGNADRLGCVHVFKI